MPSKDRRTLSIAYRTQLRLKKLGGFGDSYDRIINFLVDEHEKIEGRGNERKETIPKV
jgi:hypothetical protein